MHNYRHYVFIALVVVALGAGVTLTLLGTDPRPVPVGMDTSVEKHVVPTESGTQLPTSTKKSEVVAYPFGSPISNASARVLKKPFGIYITPETSPVEGDRFNGYHVGVDFETFENEQERDVAVFAICDGQLLLKKMASGYGGVVVQECELEGRKVQVIYGHIRLESVSQDTGTMLKRGDQIAVLGRGYSPETDGVRKHLHLGIHDGSYDPEKPDIRGYVKEEAEAGNWLNALEYLAP